MWTLSLGMWCYRMGCACAVWRMKSIPVIVIALVLGLRGATGAASSPRLVGKGHRLRSVVDDKPYVMLAGEFYSSSPPGPDYINSVWPKLERLDLNIAIATVSWELSEPLDG